MDRNTPSSHHTDAYGSHQQHGPPTPTRSVGGFSAVSSRHHTHSHVHYSASEVGSHHPTHHGDALSIAGLTDKDGGSKEYEPDDKAGGGGGGGVRGWFTRQQKAGRYPIAAAWVPPAFFTAVVTAIIALVTPGAWGTIDWSVKDMDMPTLRVGLWQSTKLDGSGYISNADWCDHLDETFQESPGAGTYCRQFRVAAAVAAGIAVLSTAFTITALFSACVCKRHMFKFYILPTPFFASAMLVFGLRALPSFKLALYTADPEVEVTTTVAWGFGLVIVAAVTSLVAGVVAAFLQKDTLRECKLQSI